MVNATNYILICNRNKISGLYILICTKKDIFLGLLKKCKVVKFRELSLLFPHLRRKVFFFRYFSMTRSDTTSWLKVLLLFYIDDQWKKLSRLTCVWDAYCF